MEREEARGEADAIFRSVSMDGWESPPMIELAARLGLDVIVHQFAPIGGDAALNNGRIVLRRVPEGRGGEALLAHEIAEWHLQDRWSETPEEDADMLAEELLAGSYATLRRAG